MSQQASFNPPLTGLTDYGEVRIFAVDGKDYLVQRDGQRPEWTPGWYIKGIKEEPHGSSTRNT